MHRGTGFEEVVSAEIFDTGVSATEMLANESQQTSQRSGPAKMEETE